MPAAHERELNAAPRTLGILTGGGTLPLRVAEAALRQGRKVFLIAFQGQTPPETAAQYPHVWVRLGEAGRTIDELKKAGVQDVVMAGHIRRPGLAELKLDLRGMRFFARAGARALGDDGLLAGIARELESEGFQLIGADKILNDGLAQLGVLGQHQPDDQASHDISRGLEVARALGAVDVGQAVIVQQGFVLGVEAVEGTDALLDRVGLLRKAGLGGVLVKVTKPQQDRRIDLPTIGPQTIERAAKAGLRGIAIEAGGTIMLDQADCIATADAAGLFLVGLDLKAHGTP